MMPSQIESKYDDLNYFLPREMAVCTECVADHMLAGVVRSNPLTESCFSCYQSTSCRGKFSCVLEAIRFRLTMDWSEISEAFEKHMLGAPDYDDEEPGLSLMDVFQFAEYRPSNSRYRTALKEAFGDVELHWRGVEKNHERDRHVAGWDRFKQVVKNERRFTFWSVESPEDPDGIFATNTGEMLSEIGELVNRCDLFKEYPEGSEFWRARIHDADLRLRDRSGLFPPPASKAVHANRMSPPGVVMFYGAESPATAMKEIADPNADADRRLTYGKFLAVQNLVLLDLFNLTKLPSYFNLAQEDEWNEVSFLHRFASEISQPIRRREQCHVEYAPTQAFTEFVRWVMKRGNDRRIDGIRYRSTKDGLPCVVLFCTAEHCRIEGSMTRRSDWLTLVEGSVKTEIVRKAFRRLASQT